MAGKRLQATIPPPLLEKLEQISTEKGMSKSVVLTLALEDYFKKLGKEQLDENK